MMNFDKFIQTDNGLRELFGVKELIIIRKQINGIQLTQSEKNRLSRDIRPKLNIVKKLSKFEDEFKLKKNSNLKKIILKSVKEIKKDSLFSSIKSILLFGSVVDGTNNFRSDIDIAVVFKDISLKDSTKFRSRLMGGLSSKVDLEVFNNLPFKIKQSIAKNHKVLFQKKDFDDFVFSVKYSKEDDLENNSV